MAQFQDMSFTFNGQSSDNYRIVNVQNTRENELGLKKSIQEVDNDNVTKTFTGIKYEEFSFTIDIMKMEQTTSATDTVMYKPIKMDKADFNYLNRWLMRPKDYRQFISEQDPDIIYYVIFTDMRETQIGNYNYVTLTMRLNAGFAYSTVQYDEFNDVNGSKTITLKTHSTVDEYIYPDIEIVMQGGTSVSIKNNTLNETMSLTQLTDGYTYICYNEDMKYIKCVDDETVNMRNKFNKVWLRLNGYGEDSITITGNCKIKIYFQNKLAIQH